MGPEKHREGRMIVRCKFGILHAFFVGEGEINIFFEKAIAVTNVKINS